MVGRLILIFASAAQSQNVGASVAPVPLSYEGIKPVVGESHLLPWSGSIVTADRECVEVVVQEEGVDADVRVVVDGVTLNGDGGEISRFGRPWLVVCPDHQQTVSWRVARSEAGPESSIRSAIRRFGRDSSDDGFQQAAEAFVALSMGDETQATARFIECAERFDGRGDLDRATMAALNALLHAGRIVDRDAASRAFAIVAKRSGSLHWTRAGVVALNDYALMMKARNPREAAALINRAHLEQQSLHDRALASAVENNRCLITHEYGDLTAARACFSSIVAQNPADTSAAWLRTKGAARNNLALVLLHQGAYAHALPQFQQSVAERESGGDHRGSLMSQGNVALSQYYSGEITEALTTLHTALDRARANRDSLAVAKLSQYLASIYLVWGDPSTAIAYIDGAESFYREADVRSELSFVLRVRAEIEADAGDQRRALEDAQDGWQTAVDVGQMQAASNLSSVYARLLMAAGELAEAQRFIESARHTINTQFAASNALSLDVVELTLMRRSGRIEEARRTAPKLLKKLLYPGLLRSQVLIEQFLTTQFRSANQVLHDYAVVLHLVRQDGARISDPEFGNRLSDLLRPATELAIGAAVASCEHESSCADTAPTLALQFAREASIDPSRPIDRSGELPGLLSALAIAQSHGDLSQATENLQRSIRQADARGRASVEPIDETCLLCGTLDQADAPLVYFFGVEKSWRWQRTDAGWATQPMPRIADIKTAVRMLSQAETRGDAIRRLSVLLQNLAAIPRERIAIAGDALVRQIPFVALSFNNGEPMIEGHAVIVLLVVSDSLRTEETVSGLFVEPASDSGLSLPSVADEHQVFDRWARNAGLSVATGKPGQSAPLTIVHIAAHGQSDAAAGTPAIWLGTQTLIPSMLTDVPAASIVVLNVCDSAASSVREFPQSSIASSFHRIGAERVVGTLFPISDAAAVGFSRSFYAELQANGENIAESTRSAQHALRLGRYSAYEWAAYVVTQSVH